MKRRGFSTEDFGFCETFKSVHFDKDGNESDPQYEILISVLDTKCGVGAVAHELVHAACSYCRMFYPDEFTSEFWTDAHDEKYMVEHGDPYSPEENPEERLAYLISNMTSEFWTEFYDRGYDKICKPKACK